MTQGKIDKRKETIYIVIIYTLVADWGGHILEILFYLHCTDIHKLRGRDTHKYIHFIIFLATISYQ